MFSHIDLDGVGSGILHKAAYGKGAETYYCGYHDVDEKIQEIITDIRTEDPSEYPTIIIADLGISQETATMVDEYRGQKLLLDHHKTNLWLMDKYDWVVIDTSKSGILLVFDHILDVPRRYGGFAKMVDDYDRWIHSNPKSVQLNRLFGILGIKRFEERCLTFPFVTSFTDVEKLLLELEDETIEYYAKKVKRGLSKRNISDSAVLGIGFADRYVSEVAHSLMASEDLDAIVLIDPIDKKASLRSKDDIDVSEIAKRLGGGGHKNASGINFDTSEEGSPVTHVSGTIEDVKVCILWSFIKTYIDIENEKITELLERDGVML